MGKGEVDKEEEDEVDKEEEEEVIETCSRPRWRDGGREGR